MHYQLDPATRGITIHMTTDEFNNNIMLPSEVVKSFLDNAPNGAMANEIKINDVSLWNIVKGQYDTQKAQLATVINWLEHNPGETYNA